MRLRQQVLRGYPRHQTSVRDVGLASHRGLRGSSKATKSICGWRKSYFSVSQLPPQGRADAGANDILRIERRTKQDEIAQKSLADSSGSETMPDCASGGVLHIIPYHRIGGGLKRSEASRICAATTLKMLKMLKMLC